MDTLPRQGAALVSFGNLPRPISFCPEPVRSLASIQIITTCTTALDLIRNLTQQDRQLLTRRMQTEQPRMVPQFQP
jgi:hypothetical protein